MRASETTCEAVTSAANALRAHWNKVKAEKGNPGDRIIGEKIAALLEAIAAHATNDATVIRAAWALLVALEDPTAAPEDETRAALDLRRALGGEAPAIDAFAALQEAKRAVLIRAGWSRSAPDADADEWWFHPTMGRETLDCALAIEEHEQEQRVRLTTKAGAS